MPDGGTVAGIAAQQHHIGAMERDHDPRALAGRQHGHCEHGRGGVGHGVVHVQNVEALRRGDLGHLHRQRQRVVRVFEQIIVVDLHGMKMNARLVARHAERRRVADEMHVVAPLGELRAELGREDAAAADGRVAGDADAEGTVRHQRRLAKKSVGNGRRVWITQCTEGANTEKANGGNPIDQNLWAARVSGAREGKTMGALGQSGWAWPRPALRPWTRARVSCSST